MMSRFEKTLQEEMICLEGVSKKYNDRWILKDIDYSFYIGTSSALVGHNGCGKSPLLFQFWSSRGFFMQRCCSVAIAYFFS